jgi:hypothetical protein
MSCKVSKQRMGKARTTLGKVFCMYDVVGIFRVNVAEDAALMLWFLVVIRRGDMRNEKSKLL